MKILSFILLSCILFLGCSKPLDTVNETNIEASIYDSQTDKSIVFIAGYDEGDMSFYKEANLHFKSQNVGVIDGLFSLAEIIEWLNANGDPVYNTIHIVSHSNAWRGMSLKTISEGERITTQSLTDAMKTGSIPKLKKGVSENTEIVFHSCGLGENEILLGTLKEAFSKSFSPKIVASPFFNVFGGKYASHYLAKPYYGYYPTAESPGPKALSEEFKKSYPNVPIDWFSALKTRTEAGKGQVYTHKFNIPVEWEINFGHGCGLPASDNREDIMDWIAENEEMAIELFALGIPLEKFRWRAKITGNTLYIKGKTTVLCVLQPIINPLDSEEYMPINTNDSSIYKIQ